MDFPQITGIEVVSLIGEGCCGSVYLGKSDDTTALMHSNNGYYAIRVFNSMTINRSLIEGVVKRLTLGAYSEGVLPMGWLQSNNGPDCLVMPCIAEVDDLSMTAKPRTLNSKISQHPSSSSWDLITQIAQAIAHLHQCNVAHGNLKPGNIFYDEDSPVLLTDPAMGLMPGVSLVSFSDALLYAPPEQLKDTSGYLDGLGYRWDTYAFGVLSYRLLTGSFPRCHTLFAEIEAQVQDPTKPHINYSQSDLAESLEAETLTPWRNEPSNPREAQKRDVIERCLSLNPQERPQNLNEVLTLWKSIDDQQALQLEKKKTKASYVAAAAAAATASLLGILLISEKGNQADTNQSHAEALSKLSEEKKTATLDKDAAILAKSAAETRESSVSKNAITKEANLKEQLIYLGETNDNIISWVMRTQNEQVPELTKSQPESEIIATQLQTFLEKIDGTDEFLPIKARVTMQLAELKLLAKKPHEADLLLDKAIPLWETSNINDPSRIARARLACLLQSQDLKITELTEALLPKARRDISTLTSGDEVETKRINAIMQIIDGRMVQESDPEKAFEHFNLALKDLKEIHTQLPEHVIIRTELAQQTLKTTALAESLMRVDDANRLRSEAAIHLRWLLEKNPKLESAKVKLAKLEILAAEQDMRSGNERDGVTKLAHAEGLLKSIPTDDTEPDGAAYQLAVANGLSSVILRDRGRITDAANNLDQSIRIMQKITDANPSEPEPLYRLAIFNWQRAGLAGSKGDHSTELKQGEKAAQLMEKLLAMGSEKRDTEVRRALAYLYGNLGTISSRLGKNELASTHYDNATKVWKKLIQLNGAKEEYTQGLKWCQSR